MKIFLSVYVGSQIGLIDENTMWHCTLKGHNQEIFDIFKIKKLFLCPILKENSCPRCRWLDWHGVSVVVNCVHYAATVSA